jgi:hypothetical protein
MPHTGLPCQSRSASAQSTGPSAVPKLPLLRLRQLSIVPAGAPTNRSALGAGVLHPLVSSMVAALAATAIEMTLNFIDVSPCLTGAPRAWLRIRSAMRAVNAHAFGFGACCSTA